MMHSTTNLVLMFEKAFQVFMITIACMLTARAQISKDNISFHFQQTVVTQGHPSFSAPYTGSHSLITKEEIATSLTTTMYLALRPAKYTTLYFNPEIAGGAGMSRATGVAGFPNGETFRVGNPAPQVYMARIYVEQLIPLSKETITREDGVNQVKGIVPASYVKIAAGRFAISDFFDCNSVSHDPRSQFLNWSLMSNGAYDYAANTRGYTWGGLVEVAIPAFTFRTAMALVPKEANLSNMELNISNAHAFQAEIEKSWGKGIIRFLVFSNKAHMGNYDASVALNPVAPSILDTRLTGRMKSGFGINTEQKVSENSTAFFRASWNDGKNETWMFTEIDQSVSGGISGNGKKWKRVNDVWGIAGVLNGISEQHRHYMAAGGNGFMVGDGRLNYANEFILELFYNVEVHDQHFFITPDYQFVLNPAYNKDRGPVHVLALRVQSKF